MPSTECSSGVVSHPTLYGLSLLPKRDLRIKADIGELGPRLLLVIRDGRRAVKEGDQQLLNSVTRRYCEIRGKGGQPDSINEYLQEGKTHEGSRRLRAAVAEIIKISAPHLEEETILRYMRMGSSETNVTPDHVYHNHVPSEPSSKSKEKIFVSGRKPSLVGRFARPSQSNVHPKPSPELERIKMQIRRSRQLSYAEIQRRLARPIKS